MSKRKRSDSEVSPFSTSTASYSSRDPSISPCPEVQMLDQQAQWFNQAPWPRPSSASIDSRTKKRHRNNRPSDEAVHATTYEKLFAAARSPPVQDTPRPNALVRPTLPPRQPSLHNYWTICKPPREIEQPVEPIQSCIHCEDCDNVLPVDQDVSMDGMDDSTSSPDVFQCRHCKRRVCDMCAVVETGIGRDCLQCRTSRKMWSGGIGWLS